MCVLFKSVFAFSCFPCSPLLSSFLAHIFAVLLFDIPLLFQLFLSPPVSSPSPRWFHDSFTAIYETFGAVTRALPPNVHLLPLYSTTGRMFELDGRNLMSAFGKDYIDHLISSSDTGMVQVSLDTDVRMSGSDNRLAVVEGRVDLVRHDMASSSQRLDVVVARAAEDTDASLNDKLVYLFDPFILLTS